MYHSQQPAACSGHLLMLTANQVHDAVEVNACIIIRMTQNLWNKEFVLVTLDTL